METIDDKNCFECVNMDSCVLLTHEDRITAISSRLTFCSTMVRNGQCKEYTEEDVNSTIVDCTKMQWNKRTDEKTIGFRVYCTKYKQEVISWKMDDLTLLENLGRQMIKELSGYTGIDQQLDPYN